jgi:hypothetical protein
MDKLKFFISLLLIFTVLIINAVYIIKQDIKSHQKLDKKFEYYRNFNQRIKTIGNKNEKKLKTKILFHKKMC